MSTPKSCPKPAARDPSAKQPSPTCQRAGPTLLQPRQPAPCERVRPAQSSGGDGTAWVSRLLRRRQAKAVLIYQQSHPGLLKTTLNSTSSHTEWFRASRE